MLIVSLEPHAIPLWEPLNVKHATEVHSMEMLDSLIVDHAPMLKLQEVQLLHAPVAQPITFQAAVMLSMPLLLAHHAIQLPELVLQDNL
jgi:hypothetical protein